MDELDGDLEQSVDFTKGVHIIGRLYNAYNHSNGVSVFSFLVFPGQPKRPPLRGRLLQYSIDIRDNFARSWRKNAP